MFEKNRENLTEWQQQRENAKRRQKWRQFSRKMQDFAVAIFFILVVGAFLFAVIYPRWLWATGEIDSHEYMRISGQTPRMLIVE